MNVPYFFLKVEIIETIERTLCDCNVKYKIMVSSIDSKGIFQSISAPEMVSGVIKM